MAYNTIGPADIVRALVQWIKAEQPTIETISVFAGGWEGWARNQFALWLQAQLQMGLRNNNPLDVLTEANFIPTAEGAVPVFESTQQRADLVFNALSPTVEAEPPVVIMELKCQSPKQQWTAFRAGLSRDVAKLYGVNPDVDDTFGADNVTVLSAGICFNVPNLRPAAGYRVEGAGNQYAVQWWADPDLVD
ncbi:hypothetical protein ACIGNX_00060 [Actinosynnema sp. NPDC053489]|uniref:hypothetical protein n=1 Tax=Actinosynnema sp. NPDC053489 TaxID=3363916 RepID=UPI0037CA2929